MCEFALQPDFSSFARLDSEPIQSLEARIRSFVLKDLSQHTVFLLDEVSFFFFLGHVYQFCLGACICAIIEMTMPYSYGSPRGVSRGHKPRRRNPSPKWRCYKRERAVV